MLTEAKGGGGREGKRRRYHRGGIQKLSFSAMLERQASRGGGGHAGGREQRGLWGKIGPFGW